MYFKTSLFCTLLIASVTLAVPTTLPGSGLARRREGRQSRPMNHIAQEGVSSVERQMNPVYSTNWGGGVYSGEINGMFISVTGTFTVPTPSGNSGTSASAWVGIDGASCDSVILQTGVDFNVVDENDGVSYTPWYEWYPAAASSFPEGSIDINSGDTLRVTVTADSSTSGTATIENMSNGGIVSQYITSDSPLCMTDAEWIVEDFESDGGLVPFANFDVVNFTAATAATVYGNNWNAEGAQPFDIRQNGQVLTQSYIDSYNNVIIKYN